MNVSYAWSEDQFFTDNNSATQQQDEFLPVEEAYLARIEFNNNTIDVVWTITDKYFLYKHGFANSINLAGQIGTAALLSFTPPVIKSVNGCKDVNKKTIDCPRDGGSRLTITGTNFGPSKPVLMIGGLVCTHDNTLYNSLTQDISYVPKHKYMV